jgi:hypothetical protein
VSLPVFQFLFWRWNWRLLLWWQLIWRISRLDFQLIPTHPDLSVAWADSASRTSTWRRSAWDLRRRSLRRMPNT